MKTHMEDDGQWTKSYAQMNHLNHTKAELRRQSCKFYAEST